MTVLAAQIASLPALDKYTPFRAARTCKICGQAAIPFDHVDFNKFCAVENYYEFGISGVSIGYLRCLFCGFIFTEDFDAWSRDDFARLVYNADYIKVDGDYVNDRPTRVAEYFAAKLRGCEDARLLDYGSGAGVFVERMRGFGFRNIEAYDPFSSPRRPVGTFDIVTCFEVIEHATDPIGVVGDMLRYLRKDGCVLFSQTVQPPDILLVRGNWWYLAPRNGHVSTFSEEALTALAACHGCVLHRGSTVYGLAPQWPSSFAGLALSKIGPSFAILRLFAPTACGDASIAFPSPTDVLWHPAENDGTWSYRWTGTGSVPWDARWGEIESVQIRIPIVREVNPGSAAGCELEVGAERKPVRLDRGEMVAEFDVAGRTGGQVVLHLAPMDKGKPGRPPFGVAVLLTQAPQLPANALVPSRGLPGNAVQVGAASNARSLRKNRVNSV